MQFLILFGFIVYFFALFFIGFYFYKKNKKELSFALGDRNLNYWVTALSAQASDMSDWLFMAFPALIYSFGLNQIWVAVGLVIFMFLTWQFVAKKFRVETEATNSLTLFSFLNTKLNFKNNNFRILSGLICLYFFIFYIAAGFVGLGRVFELAFSIDYFYGLAIGFIITILYTMLGGFLAIAWSDLFQGLFLFLVIIFVPIFTIFKIIGFNAFFSTLKSFSLDKNNYNLANYLSINVSDIFGTFIGIFSWGLGYFGQPHILVNFMGIDNPENIKKSKIVGITWQILVLSAAILVGLVGRVYFSNSLNNPELVFIKLVQLLFSEFYAGFILCAILAATISTMNTQLLVSSVLLYKDIFAPIFKFNCNEKQQLFLTRCSIFIIPLISLFFSLNKNSAVLNLVLYAWSGLGACFGPLVLAVLYKRQVNKVCATLGLICALLVVLLHSFLKFKIPALIIGFVLNFIICFSY